MQKKYKVTVIGAGDRGSCYMNALKKYYDGIIDWETVCDIQPDRMENAFTEFGFKNKEESWEKAIRSSRADFVVIAVPAYFHCDMAMFAMRCGSHVLTEKPMDLFLAKAFALKECAEQTGKAVAIGMQYRNLPQYRAAKHAIDQNLFGKNLMIHYTDIRETRPKIAMHDAVYGNGGSMVDMACHLFDLMRWYFNSDPVRVSCQWRANAVDRPMLKSIGTKAPDACFMIVEYENGSSGNIMMNWGLPEGLETSACTITGSEGLFTVTGGLCSGDSPFCVLTKGGKSIQVDNLPEDADDLINPERAVIKHFLAEIEGEGKSQVSVEHGIICLATSMAAIRSGALGRPVTLEEIYKLRPTIKDCMDAME